MNTVPAIAFKNKYTERYLSEGPDFMDLTDPNGDVADLTDALCIVRIDRKKPTDKDLTDFYNWCRSVTFLFDFNDLKNCYDPVHVDLSMEQYKTIKKRHEEGY
ncbi:hypothetical protein P9173_13770 [Bacillus safensis]|uniref:hypothetical protein n=1 Tax=Bacillus safensis TaxID=561879 RepID=UPI0022821ABD|nr:hypothetical protein [Bacillus safensis]MCY7542194.1 hypothetical protein [Bacillus safensis]MCY7551818.1 hypothetical protein [Bacillus safensis]MCY7644620.1 hypothetical protein [Bacillus safensis]MCY7654595.1 hypothetical protein [Bacillus safensis]MEC3711232.1 hypothetical protein [Bacillus safensis]